MSEFQHISFLKLFGLCTVGKNFPTERLCQNKIPLEYCVTVAEDCCDNLELILTYFLFIDEGTFQPANEAEALCFGIFDRN